MLVEPTIYEEEQGVRAPWIVALVAALCLGCWFVFGSQLLLGRTVGENPPPDAIAALLLLVFGVGFPWLLFAFRLTVEVWDDELRWSLRPFSRRRAALADVVSVEPCRYHPLRDYFGWGLRWMPGKGWAYTVGGNLGVRVELASGERVMIGSVEPQKLADAIARAPGFRGEAKPFAG